VFTCPGRIGPERLVDDGELIAVTEVDEGLVVPVQVQIDAPVLVVVVGLRRAIGIGEADTPRIVLDDLRIITGITALTPVRGRPVSLLKLASRSL
jgi:hypothetical protein